MKNNIIKLKKEKRSKIEKGDLVAISKTGKAQKMETNYENLKNIKFDNVQKMKLELSSKPFDAKKIDKIKPEDIMNGGATIKLEASCGHKFLKDFLDFLESKIIKK